MKRKVLPKLIGERMPEESWFSSDSKLAPGWLVERLQALQPSTLRGFGCWEGVYRLKTRGGLPCASGEQCFAQVYRSLRNKRSPVSSRSWRLGSRVSGDWAISLSVCSRQKTVLETVSGNLPALAEPSDTGEPFLSPGNSASGSGSQQVCSLTLCCYSRVLNACLSPLWRQGESMEGNEDQVCPDWLDGSSQSGESCPQFPPSSISLQNVCFCGPGSAAFLACHSKL